MRLLSLLVLFSQLAVASTPAGHDPACEAAVQPQLQLVDPTLPAQNETELKAAWETTVKGLNDMRTQNVLVDVDSLMADIGANILAKLFVFIFGEPGGAKTYVARTMFLAELGDEAELRLFLLQFHKLMQENVIIGMPKLQKLLDEGLEEIETSTSLVGERFLFTLLDEIEKAPPATVTSLLSVLQERQALHGSTLIEAALRSGAATSNKNTLAFRESFGKDAATADAILDRFSTKYTAPDRLRDPALTARMILAKQAAQEAMRNGTKISRPRTQISKLTPLVEKIEISDSVMLEAAEVLMELDALLMQKANEVSDTLRGAVAGTTNKATKDEDNIVMSMPASQFSTRSDLKSIQLLKTRFLMEQLMSGVPYERVKLTIERGDLVYLATGTIYGAPGQLRKKRVKLGREVEKSGQKIIRCHTTGHLNRPFPYYMELDPYLGVIHFMARHGKHSGRILVDLEKGIIHDNGLIASEEDKAHILEEYRAALQRPVEIEDDGILEKYINIRSLPRESRIDLKHAQFERNMLLTLLNNMLRNAPKQYTAVPAEVLDMKSGAELHLQGEERAWYDVHRAYKQFSAYFRNMEYVVRAIFTGLLSKHHVALFGGPGGAKTFISKKIMEEFLKSANQRQFGYESRKALEKAFAEIGQTPEAKEFFELFFLQFHPMIPESKLVGMQVLKEVLDNGRIVYRFTDSMAASRFIVAILDEWEKGNPAVVAALLQLLNERSVFNGSQVIQTNLRTVILSSNKTPAEIQDSAGQMDQGSVRAILNRVINKVYVMNKFMTPEDLAAFLVAFEGSGRKTLNEMLDNINLDILGLDGMRDRVSIGASEMHLFTKVAERFSEKQQRVREQQEDLHYGEEAAENPNFHIPAATGSSRITEQIIDQVRSSFLLEQMLTENKAYSDVKYKMGHADVVLMAYGFVHWAPWKINRKENNGIMFYEIDSDIDAISQNQTLNPRHQFILKKIASEVRDFVDIANTEVHRLLTDYRDVIQQLPNLFPTLILNKKKMEERFDSIESTVETADQAEEAQAAAERARRDENQ